MWSGYLDERAKNEGLCEFLKSYSYRVLHTSGHAAPEDLRRLYETVKPKRGLIPIHTDAPDLFRELVPEGNIILLQDGEEFGL
jgi:ribonuclease J